MADVYEIVQTCNVKVGPNLTAISNQICDMKVCEGLIPF